MSVQYSSSGPSAHLRCSKVFVMNVGLLSVIWLYGMFLNLSVSPTPSLPSGLNKYFDKILVYIWGSYGLHFYPLAFYNSEETFLHFKKSVLASVRRSGFFSQANSNCQVSLHWVSLCRALFLVFSKALCSSRHFRC